MDEDSQSRDGVGDLPSTPSVLLPPLSSAGAHSTRPSGDSGAGVHSIAKYKLMSPANLPISRSPCMTVPSGLSPTSFLESPVLLSNIKVEPSPTTGSFFNAKLMPISGGTAELSLATNFSHSNKDDTKSSEFKFQAGYKSASQVSSTAHPIVSGFNGQESKIVEKLKDQHQSDSLGVLSLVNSENAEISKDLRLSAAVNMLSSGVSLAYEADTDHLNKKGHVKSGAQVSESDHTDNGRTGMAENKENLSSVMAERSSDDGYNWRKYGQKLVKGGEFPRSYYKCTYPNCEVKKIFERAYDGQITEIVYKGTHDHPKPQPSRRFTAGALMSIQQDRACEEDKSTIDAQTCIMDRSGTPLMSSQQVNDDSMDGTASYLNNANDDVDEDDPALKRRRLEAGIIDVTPVVKPIREPRVVVQTVSEVDILDDGYRWRKYGQKVVRGNPNPRSYYKCTSAGCPVRKHVERASHDPKAVITTYEGKHNHEVPTSRASSHEISGPSAADVMSGIVSTEKDTISLNLGVGLGYASANRTSVPMDSESIRSQIPVASSIKVPPVSGVSPCFGVIYGGANLCGSRDNHVEAPPLNHTSDQYPHSLGSVLLGP